FTVCFFVASKFFIFSSGIVQKSLFMLVILITVLHLILIDLCFEQNTQQSGIIISNEVNAYSGPFVGENTMLFTINEGTRAKIYQKQGDWIEIAIINGDKAWIPSKTFRQL
ncbi:MAG: SH3 domain-containing protein, partial [Candidatus Marinimicrobia bacterium]|nr:SH3 domain-containing protein [Candidatus Neomarinimicrobiota bacterium]